MDAWLICIRYLGAPVFHQLLGEHPAFWNILAKLRTNACKSLVNFLGPWGLRRF
jgi:hypothetical protein